MTSIIDCETLKKKSKKCYHPTHFSFKSVGLWLPLPIPKLVILFEVERVRNLRMSIFVNNYENRRTVRKLKSTIKVSSPCVTLLFTSLGIGSNIYYRLRTFAKLLRLVYHIVIQEQPRF